MKYGFLYLLVSYLIRLLNFLSLVELFKFVGRLFNPDKLNLDKVSAYNRISTDVFIVFKWMLLAVFWKLRATNNFCTIVVWYLIVANIFSYFFYHVWDKESLNPDNFTIDRVKRRFVTLMLAITFSTFCFAYLYQVPYCNRFEWSGRVPQAKLSLMYSFSNSLAANYSRVVPKDDFGDLVSTFQLLITFFFLTIILSKSVPQTTSET